MVSLDLKFIIFRKINGFEVIANLEEKLGIGNRQKMLAFLKFQSEIHFQRKALQMWVQKMDSNLYLIHQF